MYILYIIGHSLPSLQRGEMVTYPTFLDGDGHLFVLSKENSDGMDTSPFSLEGNGDETTSPFYLKGMGVASYIYVNYNYYIYSLWSIVYIVYSL